MLVQQVSAALASRLIGGILEGNAGGNEIFVKAGGNDVVDSILFAQVIVNVVVSPFLENIDYRFLERLTPEAHSNLLEASSCDKEPYKIIVGVTV
jgi:hypothetical protein